MVVLVHANNLVGMIVCSARGCVLVGSDRDREPADQIGSEAHAPARVNSKCFEVESEE